MRGEGLVQQTGRQDGADARVDIDDRDDDSRRQALQRLDEERSDGEREHARDAQPDPSSTTASRSRARTRRNERRLKRERKREMCVWPPEQNFLTSGAGARGGRSRQQAAEAQYQQPLVTHSAAERGNAHVAQRV